jgi:hypothetical protein
MADKPKATQRSASEERRRRLGAALRENLAKRKEQARTRAAAAKPQPRAGGRRPDES